MKMKMAERICNATEAESCFPHSCISSQEHNASGHLFAAKFLSWPHQVPFKALWQFIGIQPEPWFVCLCFQKGMLFLSAVSNRVVRLVTGFNIHVAREVATRRRGNTVASLGPW